MVLQPARYRRLGALFARWLPRVQQRGRPERAERLCGAQQARHSGPDLLRHTPRPVGERERSRSGGRDERGQPPAGHRWLRHRDRKSPAGHLVHAAGRELGLQRDAVDGRGQPDARRSRRGGRGAGVLLRPQDHARRPVPPGERGAAGNRRRARAAGGGGDHRAVQPAGAHERGAGDRGLYCRGRLRNRPGAQRRAFRRPTPGCRPSSRR